MPEQTDAIVRRNNVVIRVLIISAFVVILNETIMGVAIPHLMEDLGITAVDAQWLTAGFLLTMSVVIPITGWLLQRFPTRPLYIVAMSTFVAGTALAAVAPGFEVLLLARVVQASGTAVMFPLLMTTVISLVPEAERGRRMGNIGLVISVAPALGPTISGLILAFLPWRYLFVFVLPVAIAVLVFGLRTMRSTNETRPAPLDVFSVVLAGIGFGSFVYGLSLIGESASGDPTRAVTFAAVGAAVIALFVWRQIALQRRDAPLLDLRVFRERTYAIAAAMFMVAMVSLFGVLILLPLFMQDVLGYTVLQSGLMLLPGGLTLGLLARPVGKLYDRIGPRPLLIPGTSLVAASLWALALVLSPSTPWWLLLACHVAMSAGLAFIFTPLFTASLGALPKHLYSHGSATISTLQQVSAAAGTALFVSTMTAVALSQDGVEDAQSLSSGMQAAFVVGGILATAGIVLAALIRAPESAGDGETADDDSLEASATAH